MKIIVRLKGGMGNQMFEYACGRALQLRNEGYELILDISELERHAYPRNYALGCFNIPSTVRVCKLDCYDKYSRLKNPILRVMQKFIPRITYKIYARHNIFIWDESEFREVIIRNDDDIFLNGYWQSSRYFTNEKNNILNDFTFKQDLSVGNQLLRRNLQKCESVCVHVRLGDYLTNKAYIVCNKEYYLRGIDYISQQKPDAVFFIFSDEISTAKKMFGEKNKKYNFIDSNNSENADLELMSCCKNFVISNSSFSWWAQYLAQNDRKIVVAPSKWNNDEKIKDIYEHYWVLL